RPPLSTVNVTRKLIWRHFKFINRRAANAKTAWAKKDVKRALKRLVKKKVIAQSGETYVVIHGNMSKNEGERADGKPVASASQLKGTQETEQTNIDSADVLDDAKPVTELARMFIATNNNTACEPTSVAPRMEPNDQAMPALAAQRKNVGAPDIANQSAVEETREPENAGMLTRGSSTMLPKTALSTVPAAPDASINGNTKAKDFNNSNGCEGSSRENGAKMVESAAAVSLSLAVTEDSDHFSSELHKAGKTDSIDMGNNGDKAAHNALFDKGENEDIILSNDVVDDGKLITVSASMFIRTNSVTEIESTSDAPRMKPNGRSIPAMAAERAPQNHANQALEETREPNNTGMCMNASSTMLPEKAPFSAAPEATEVEENAGIVTKVSSTKLPEKALFSAAPEATEGDNTSGKENLNANTKVKDFAASASFNESSNREGSSVGSGAKSDDCAAVGSFLPSVNEDSLKFTTSYLTDPSPKPHKTSETESLDTGNNIRKAANKALSIDNGDCENGIPSTQWDRERVENSRNYFDLQKHCTKREKNDVGVASTAPRQISLDQEESQPGSHKPANAAPKSAPRAAVEDGINELRKFRLERATATGTFGTGPDACISNDVISIESGTAEADDCNVRRNRCSVPENGDSESNGTKSNIRDDHGKSPEESIPKSPPMPSTGALKYPVGCPVWSNMKYSKPFGRYLNAHMGLVKSASWNSLSDSMVYEIERRNDNVYVDEADLAFAIHCPVYVRMEGAGDILEAEGEIVNVRLMVGETGEKSMTYTVMVTLEEDQVRVEDGVVSDRIAYRCGLKSLQAKIRHAMPSSSKQRGFAIRSTSSGRPLQNPMRPVINMIEGRCAIREHLGGNSCDDDSNHAEEVEDSYATYEDETLSKPAKKKRNLGCHLKVDTLCDKKGKIRPYTGVTEQGNGYGYTTRIPMNKRQRHLGIFKLRANAALAYDEAMKTLRGNYKINFSSRKEWELAILTEMEQAGISQSLDDTFAQVLAKVKKKMISLSRNN
ncbi:hypothetical protein ACHAWF_009705, partial [Thalassiosira exigua]